MVAVGNDKHVVEIYTVGSDNKFRLTEELIDSTDMITALSFTQDGGALAVGNSKGKIRVYNTAGMFSTVYVFETDANPISTSLGHED